jgi:hypothetical protein
MGGVFVSYRRKDSAGHAGRLFDRLLEHFGKDRVFRDVDRLRAGDDFVESLAREVGSCEAFILVIGPDWLDARDEAGRRRLDDPEDFIRIELETALRRKILVLPVLVEGAKMVEAADLPESIRPLARRQAIELSEHRWDFDVQELLQRIQEVVKPHRSKRKAAFTISAVVAVLLMAGLFALYWSNTPPAKETEKDQAAVTSDAVTPPVDGKAALVPQPDPTPPPVDPPPVETPSPRPEGSKDAARPTQLPQFVGQSLRDVTATMRRLGLQQKVEFNSAGRRAAGTVFNQRPAAGSPLIAGSLVHLHVQLGLRPEEHAAGQIYLTPSEVLMLDHDEDDPRRSWDVSLERAAEANLGLRFGEGAAGSRVPPAASNPRGLDPAQCRSITSWARSILLPQRFGTGMDVCVRTTKGRVALLRLEALTAEPELKLRYSTLR